MLKLGRTVGTTDEPRHEERTAARLGATVCFGDQAHALVGHGEFDLSYRASQSRALAIPQDAAGALLRNPELHGFTHRRWPNRCREDWRLATRRRDPERARTDNPEAEPGTGLLANTIRRDVPREAEG